MQGIVPLTPYAAQHEQAVQGAHSNEQCDKDVQHGMRGRSGEREADAAALVPPVVLTSPAGAGACRGPLRISGPPPTMFPLRDLLTSKRDVLGAPDADALIASLVAASGRPGTASAASVATPRASLTSLLAFHQRVQDGSADRRDAIAFWVAFTSRGGLDPLFAVADSAAGDTVALVSRLLEFCYTFAKTQSELQSKIAAWVPRSPQALLRLFQACIGNTGTVHCTLGTVPVDAAAGGSHR